MGRNTSAAHAAPLPAAHVSAGTAQQPANDVVERAVAASASSVDADARTRLIALALALTLGPRRHLPSHPLARLTWMAAILATAREDHAQLAQVALDGPPVTLAELEDWGERLTLARELVVRGSVPAATTTTKSDASREPAHMSDDDIKGELRQIHGALCDAFVARFGAAQTPAGSDAARAIADKRAVVQTVRRSNSDAALADNSVRLLGLCGEPGTVAWLRTLPKGEGVNLDRMTALHPEWVRRQQSRPTPRATRASSELTMRVYLLACQPLARVRSAGRYLVKGDAAREGDYAGFRAPKRRAPKASPMPPVTPPVR